MMTFTAAEQLPDKDRPPPYSSGEYQAGPPYHPQDDTGDSGSPAFDTLLFKSGVHPCSQQLLLIPFVYRNDIQCKLLFPERPAEHK